MHVSRFFHQAVLYPSAVIAIVFNSLLIFVVLHPSLRSIGAYRGLLIAFACTDMMVSGCHAFVLPVYIQIEYGATAFLWDALDYPYSVALALTIITVCLLYVSFPLLTCHFIYRYFAVARPDLIGRNLVAAVFCAILITASFTGIIVYGVWTLQSNAADHFFDDIVRREYGIDLNNASNVHPMVSMNFLNANGDWNWNSLRVIALVGSALLSTLVVNSVCVSRIVHNLSTNVKLSEQTKRLQLQFFRSLIIQFTVPFLFCVCPFAFIAIPPFFGLSFGESANLVGMLVSMFPSVDPLLVLLSFPRFRRVILGWHSKIAPITTDAVTATSLHENS